MSLALSIEFVLIVLMWILRDKYLKKTSSGGRKMSEIEIYFEGRKYSVLLDSHLETAEETSHCSVCGREEFDWELIVDVKQIRNANRIFVKKNTDIWRRVAEIAKVQYPLELERVGAIRNLSVRWSRDENDLTDEEIDYEIKRSRRFICGECHYEKGDSAEKIAEKERLTTYEPEHRL